MCTNRIALLNVDNICTTEMLPQWTKEQVPCFGHCEQKNKHNPNKPLQSQIAVTDTEFGEPICARKNTLYCVMLIMIVNESMKLQNGIWLENRLWCRLCFLSCSASTGMSIPCLTFSPSLKECNMKWHDSYFVHQFWRILRLRKVVFRKLNDNMDSDLTNPCSRRNSLCSPKSQPVLGVGITIM